MTLYPALRVGMRMTRRDAVARVRGWQHAVQDVCVPDLRIDGVFGPRTEAATRLFQALSGLEEDGIVGKRTYAAMGAQPVDGLSRLDAVLKVTGSGPHRPTAAVVQPVIAGSMIARGAVLAMFLAQLAHESGGWRYMEEVWGPTAEQRTYEPPSRKASMLGNVWPGDGKRYKGRGPIQLTGRGNYRAFDLSGTLPGVSLEEHPERAAEVAVGLLTARWFWQSRKLSVIARRGTSAAFVQITKRINGGLNGIESRMRYWYMTQQALGVA